jgi:hypothetical protein
MSMNSILVNESCRFRERVSAGVACGSHFLEQCTADEVRQHDGRAVPM